MSNEIDVTVGNMEYWNLFIANAPLLFELYMVSMVLWTVLYFTCRSLFENTLFEAGWKLNSKGKTEKQRQSTMWLYMSYIVSTIHAVILLGFGVRAMLSCNPPEALQKPGFLGNTYFYNDYCNETVTLECLQAITFFLGYITVDTLFCIFGIGVDSPGMSGTFIHHGIAVFGCVGAYWVGGVIVVLSAGSCYTELSTPFVNLRWLLYFHKDSSIVYKLNGVSMTAIFFLSRCVYQAWLVPFGLIPGLKALDLTGWSSVAEFYKDATVLMYIGLTCLNLYWFNKMFTGCMKALKGKPAPTKPRAE